MCFVCVGERQRAAGEGMQGYLAGVRVQGPASTVMTASMTYLSTLGEAHWWPRLVTLFLSFSFLESLFSAFSPFSHLASCTPLFYSYRSYSFSLLTVFSLSSL